VCRGLGGIGFYWLCYQLADERPDGRRVLNNLADSFSVVEALLVNIHEGVDVEVLHWLFRGDEKVERAVGQL